MRPALTWRSRPEQGPASALGPDCHRDERTPPLTHARRRPLFPRIRNAPRRFTCEGAGACGLLLPALDQRVVVDRLRLGILIRQFWLGRAGPAEPDLGRLLRIELGT